MQTAREKQRAIETLSDRADFLKIQNSGQKWVSQGLILQVMKNDHPHVRVGYTVSKKVHKSAVKRNRIKRRLRSVAADVLSEHGRSGVDYVLVGRLSSLDKPYDVLKKDLAWCMKKTGFYGADAGV